MGKEGCPSLTTQGWHLQGALELGEGQLGVVPRGKVILCRMDIQELQGMGVGEGKTAGGAGNGGGTGKNCWRCRDEAELGKCCSQVGDRDGKRNEEVAMSLIRSGNDGSDPMPAPNGGRWVSQTDKSQLLQVVNALISQNPK